MSAIRSIVRAGLRALAVTVMGSAFASGPASAAADFRLERLTPREMYVAPGQTVSYVLRIRNVGTVEGVAHVGDETHSSYFDDLESYSLAQASSSGCGPFDTQFTGFLNDYQIIFDAGPIAPNAYLDCAMTIVRDVASVHDMSMAWGVLVDDIGGSSYQRYVEAALVGTLTDVSIETRTFGFHLDDGGFAHATAELVIHNGGSYPFDPQNVGACEDNFARPFFTDGSGPGGCGDDFYYPTCFDWGYGFHTPEIEAGGTYSCLIQLESKQPYQDPLAFPIALDYGRYYGGLSFIDTNRDNDETLLRLEPDAAAGAPVPSNRGASLLFCGVALLALGGWRIKKRRGSLRALFRSHNRLITAP